MIVIESLVKAKNMLPVDAAQNQPFFDSASILQSNRKSLGFLMMENYGKSCRKISFISFCWYVL